MLRALRKRAAAVAPLSGWFIVTVGYALAVAISAVGLRNWGPDSRYYLGAAYRYGGLSETEAARRTFAFLGSFTWFRPYCHGGCGPDATPAAYDQLFHGPAGGLVAPRILYPLLSAPFVRLFGPQGMLVVPVLSYAVVVVLVVVLASRLIGPRWAVLAGIAVVLPLSVSRWATYAYTEALTMALFIACVVVMPLGRRVGYRQWILFGGFLLAFAFTRQFHPVVVVAVGVAWLGAVVATGGGIRSRLGNEWLPFLGIGVGVTVLAGFIQSLTAAGYSIVDSFLTHSGAGTLSGVPAAVVRVSWEIIAAEAVDIGDDFPLVLILAAAAVGMILRWRDPLSQVAAGALLGTFILHVLNTEPSHFRYYAPAFPLFAVLAVATVAHLLDGRRPLGPADHQHGVVGERVEDGPGGRVELVR